MPTNYFIGWWNVENLFDNENSPRRSEKLQRALGKDLVGWTASRRDNKIDQLVSVIVQMNAGAGPDLLGICEVENEFVVQRLVDRVNSQLPNRTYQVEHADLSDGRGIDVSFVYDPAFFSVPPSETFHHVVIRRTGTREIVQVNFQTHRGRTLTVFGNHWPSRAGGAPSESEGYRQIAGETLAYFHQRALEVHGKATPVLVMGDFNDEPFDSSLTHHALSTRERNKVVNGTSPRLWNLMWPLLRAPPASYYFGNAPNMLDQFLVNKNMVKTTSPIRVDPTSVQVFQSAGTFDPTKDYPVPIRFGGVGKKVNTAGFSDHYPITMQITEAD